MAASLEYDRSMIPTLKFLIEIALVSLVLIWLVGLIPAAVLAAKGRGGGWFAKGFFTFGVAWLYSSTDLRRFFAMAVIALLAAIFICRPVPLLGFDLGALEHSIGAGIPGDPCREIDDHHWRCDVYADGGSGSDEYLVHTTAVGCWSAQLIDPRSEQTSREMNGCVRLDDFL